MSVPCLQHQTQFVIQELQLLHYSLKTMLLVVHLPSGYGQTISLTPLSNIQKCSPLLLTSEHPLIGDSITYLTPLIHSKSSYPAVHCYFYPFSSLLMFLTHKVKHSPPHKTQVSFSVHSTTGWERSFTKKHGNILHSEHI